jgi:signal transduction histidine kinase
VRTDGVVRLTVTDDRVGFASGEAGDNGAVGLVNMRERVRQLNGTIAVESEPGRGTTILAEVSFRAA